MKKSSRGHLRSYVIAGLVAVAATILIMVAVQRAQVTARQSTCTGHLYNITQALFDYRRIHGRFPERFVPGRSGAPAHSWRVLILPELGYDDLYQQYDFDQPWNSTKNLKVLAQMPPVFTCPNCPSKDCTSYFMLVTKTRASARAANPGSDGKMSDEPDGSAPGSSVRIVENNHKTIRWTEPRDLEEDEVADDACDPSGFGFGVPGQLARRVTALPEE